MKLVLIFILKVIVALLQSIALWMDIFSALILWDGYFLEKGDSLGYLWKKKPKKENPRINRT